MTISIKNMVCPRCISSVREIALRCGLQPSQVSLGTCVLSGEPDSGSLQRFREALLEEGFEILDGREQKMVQSVKSMLVDLVYNNPQKLESINLSEYLMQGIPASYSVIRSVFSSMEGRSIENYFLTLKIERAKELVRYNEMSFSQISDTLGYSSVAHFSAQFKKITGLTPSLFRKNIGKRNHLDSI